MSVFLCGFCSCYVPFTLKNIMLRKIEQNPYSFSIVPKLEFFIHKYHFDVRYFSLPRWTGSRLKSESNFWKGININLLFSLNEYATVYNH
jgi:hypothetical protein